MDRYNRAIEHTIYEAAINALRAKTASINSPPKISITQILKRKSSSLIGPKYTEYWNCINNLQVINQVLTGQEPYL